MQGAKLPITVIVVAYNSGAYLQSCIDSLASQTFDDFEAVIADNASEDDSVERLRLPDARFRVADMGRNIGFAAANNLVAAKSEAEFLALLNPDAQAEPTWLEALVGAAYQHPNAAAIGSVQRRIEEPEILDGLGDVWHAAGLAWRGGEGRRAPSTLADGEIFGPCAAAALYRREDFLALGGFDERYFCYCEDIDLAYRLRLAGKTSLRASAAVVLHAGSGITGRSSEFSLFHGHRNRIWTFLKNTPGELFPMLLVYKLLLDAAYLALTWKRGCAPSVLRAYRAAWEGCGPFLEERRRNRPRLGPTLRLRHMALSPWSPWLRELHPKG